MNTWTITYCVQCSEVFSVDTAWTIPKAHNGDRHLLFCSRECCQAYLKEKKGERDRQG